MYKKKLCLISVRPFLLLHDIELVSEELNHLAAILHVDVMLHHVELPAWPQDGLWDQE